RDDAATAEFVAELNVGLIAQECAALYTEEISPEGLLELPEAGAVDVLLALSFEKSGMGRRRFCEVLKARGAEHWLGQHPLELASTGVRVTPRFEVFAGDAHLRVFRERAPLGI